MDNLRTSIASHVDYLSRVIGPRPSGSPGNHAAASYVADQMHRSGLVVETQPFPCPAWTCEAAEISVNGESVEILANPYSPSCEVTASIVPAATLAELETAELTGKIALLYGDLTRAPLACKSWFLKEERDVRIIQLLGEKAPAAVLAVQVQPNSTNRLIEDWEFLIPSATLPNESALWLFNRLEGAVHLRLQTQQQPGSTANVVGRRPGRRPETLVFCAHYDTKIDTPGAGDNAAGVAALLAMAETTSGMAPDATLEFVAFTNEEYLPLGDDTYLQMAGEGHLDRVLLAINFDGLGQLLDANSLAIYAASDEFQILMNQISQDFPGIQWVDPWPESNHSSFSMRGVPALALSARSAWNYAHQHEDTMRRISPARIEEAVHLTTRVLEAVQSQPLEWLRAK